MITIVNPSSVTYNNLRVLHSNTLRCPCSTTAIPYQKFILLSPILHQVCSSDFVDDRFIKMLEKIKSTTDPDDWRNEASLQFQLLSDLCHLANKTIDDAVRRFLFQYFITSNVLNETDFDTQLNATLKQFFQSTIIYFALLVDTVHLLMQVDQPFTDSNYRVIDGILRPNLMSNIVTDIENNKTSMQVCRSRHAGEDVRTDSHRKSIEHY